MFSATFACERRLNVSELTFQVEPLKLSQALRLVNEVAQTSTVGLETAGKTLAALITDLRLSLREYDGSWAFSVEASSSTPRLRDLIAMKVQNRGRSFEIRIGRTKYIFAVPNDEAERGLENVLRQCDQ